MLQLKNVVKNYPTATTTVQALRGVSLDFRESEFVAILGPSGCGKTTMLNIIGGLDRYTSGDLVIGGISTATFDDQHWDAYRNATIGFVFQSYNLIPHLTVVENVEMALCLIGEKKKERRAKAIAALQCVGMGDEINKRPNQLSGGQMQRVAIARAIVNDPKIILADEPTGALDSELSVQVMDILSELSKSRLVIMVTHNAELAYEYCSRICRFKDGQLISDSNPYDVGYTPIPEADAEYEPVEVFSEGGTEDITTDTLSLQEHDTTVDSVKERVAEDEAPVEHSTYDTEANVEDAADTQEEEIDVEGMYAEKRTRVKKVANRKRKKVMKNIGVRDNDTFNRLGINSGMKKKKTPQNKKDKSFKPTSMSAGMAFGLSLRNLISKKGRTIFTAFAGSIGIIGLGLVLAISNGFKGYVDSMQTNIMAGNPMGMYEYNVDVSMMDKMMNMLTDMMSGNKEEEGNFPEGDQITVNPPQSGVDGTNQMMNNMMNLISSFLGEVYSNDISEDFANYIKRDPSNYKAISEYYGLRYNLIAEVDNVNKEYKDISTSPSPSLVRNIIMTIFGQQGLQDPNWQLLVGGKDQMEAEFDVLKGRYPKDKSELLLCINKNNSINQTLLDAFGITVGEEVHFDDFINKTFRLVYNDAYYDVDNMTYNQLDESCGYYTPNENVYSYSDPDEQAPGTERIVDQDVLQRLYNDKDPQNGIDLKIVGVIRIKEGSTSDYVTSGICYTPELQEDVLQNAYNSKIAVMQRVLEEYAAKHPDNSFAQGKTVLGDDRLTDSELRGNNALEIMNIFTSENYGRMYSSFLRTIGAAKMPAFIKVYPTNYDQKQAIVKLIDKWNEDHKDEHVGFLDITAMITKTLDQIIDLVTYLLLAVAAISLVVSTAMIGVITSNSVVERTREIGILRSLGARKKDIRNVFIAETTLIGLAGGLMGIIVTYILCPLISLAIEAAIAGELTGTMLMFNPLHALILVVLSTALTIVSGVVPAIMASRKNVVDALRVE